MSLKNKRNFFNKGNEEVVKQFKETKSSYILGELVYLQTKINNEGKWSNNEGPFRILKKQSRNNFTVKDIKKNREVVVSVRNIRSCFQRLKTTQ